jgi:hypothetical protein
MWLREFAPSYFVTVNSHLNPKLWHNYNELDPAVEQKLLKIAQTFERFIGIDLPVVDYTITGSNANFTWTKFSDLDLHIIVKGDISDEQRELFNAKKALWTEHHNITIKGIPVECYVQGESEPHFSTGIYSVKSHRWLQEPQKTKPKVDTAEVQAKLDSIVHDIDAAIASGSQDKIEHVKDRITSIRKSGLQKGGEWSIENLAFKQLRNLGLIDKLTEKIRELEDRELSLESKN